ncbi:hypothetical protein CLOHAE12215_01846 [Clostridium haemolyticum]|uniref:hypothetical protein n=1 Tax=Clostridium haemolyticum TaxID=84025 RepID=UPI001C3A8683|nr:hypothetical protein [Clostridium haemolyticum]CAG7840422.1 hypothetical protein CLOHAE12215_01846 [Clostridium haemolyticum]
MLKKDSESYKKNNWTLEQGELVKELEGFNSETLPVIFSRNIRRAYCRVEIIKWDSKYDMRYELFNRLNTGGSPLAEQEIRNCIFRGQSNKFNEILTTLASNNQFANIVNTSETKKSQLYNEELVLRFFSLYNDEWDKYETKNMSTYMTEYMKNVINNDIDISDTEKLFNRLVKLLFSLGNNNIFRFSNNQFSTSLYDSIMVGIGNNIDIYEKEDSKYLLNKINKLKEDEDFRRYTGSASSSKSRVRNRMKRAMEIFNLQ